MDPSVTFLEGSNGSFTATRSDGAFISVGAADTSTKEYSYTLTAAADSGYVFAGWVDEEGSLSFAADEGNISTDVTCTSSDSTATFTLDAGETITLETALSGTPTGRGTSAELGIVTVTLTEPAEDTDSSES